VERLHPTSREKIREQCSITKHEVNAGGRVSNRLERRCLRCNTGDSDGENQTFTVRRRRNVGHAVSH